MLSLEAALEARPAISADTPDAEKERLLVEQARTIKELELVIAGYEDNLGEPLRQVKEDVEKEWRVKLDTERKVREEKEAWANELVRELEREKQVSTYVCFCFSIKTEGVPLIRRVGTQQTRGRKTGSYIICHGH